MSARGFKDPENGLPRPSSRYITNEEIEPSTKTEATMGSRDQLQQPAGVGLDLEILTSVVIGTSSANDGTPSQVGHEDDHTLADTRNDKDTKTKELIINRMITEESLLRDSTSGWRRITALQHLQSNAPMYRLHSHGRAQTNIHIDQKIEAVSKRLDLVLSKMDELAKIQTTLKGEASPVTRTQEGHDTEPSTRRHSPQLQAWVAEARLESPASHSRMRQELEMDRFQCFEELVALYNEQSNFLQTWAHLRTFPRVTRKTWAKTMESYSRDVDLEDPENDCSWYSDDFIILDRNQPHALEYFMHSPSIVAKAFRWWFSTTELHGEGNKNDVYLDRQRMQLTLAGGTTIGFVLVLLVPAVIMLALDLSKLTSLGLVTVGGVLVILAATSLRSQTAEMPFVMFFGYMAVMMAIVVGLGNGDRQTVALTDVCAATE